jgi:hypothetical protein
MPLLDLKTDLKSIKYGQDRADGGSSGQPYIKTDINTVDKGINKLRFGNFDEGLVRGGVIGMLNSSITDTLRIGKFLTDTPKGPLFIVKQVGLQLSNPRLESKQVAVDRSTRGGGFITNAINFISNVAGKIENIVGPTRIYNLGINTLAQVPLNGIGGHIVRHGFLPVSDPSKYYEAVVTANDPRFEKGKNNRLVKLATRFGLGNPNYKEVSGSNKLIIDDYIGGPGSVYGIGTTLINRAKDRDTSDNSRIRDAFNYSENQVKLSTTNANENLKLGSFYGVSNRAYSSLGYNNFETNANSIASNSNNNPITLEDRNALYLNEYNDKIGTYHTKDLNYPLKNENDLVKNGPSSYPDPSITGSFKYTLPSLNLVEDYNRSYDTIYKAVEKLTAPNNVGIYATLINGQLNKERLPNSKNSPIYENKYDEKVSVHMDWDKATRELRIGSGRKDQINLTPIFPAEAGTQGDTVNIPGIGKKNINDLVKFRIQAIDTDTPSSANWMIFRAYITALSDSVDAQWQDIKYAGRGDKFYIYDGFSRKMSVSFKVAALSAEEMEPMYQKLNYLMSNLMPDYKNNLMRGPLMRMTIGNWIDGQLCKLDSLSYTIPQDSPWEISLASQTGKLLELNLPHIIEVQLSFTPIGSQTRDQNKIARKSECTSNIAQNWNAKDEKGLKEYIVPCDEDKEVEPSPILPIVPPVIPPVTDPLVTGGGGGGLGEDEIKKTIFQKRNAQLNVAFSTGVNKAYIPPTIEKYVGKQAPVFGGFGGGPFGGGGGASQPFAGQMTRSDSLKLSQPYTTSNGNVIPGNPNFKPR